MTAENRHAPAPWRWVVIAVAAGVLLVITYVVFVQTVPGQRIENAALRGADQVRPEDLTEADAMLATITLYSLAAFSAGLVLFALVVRRNLRLAVAAAAIIIGSSAITQVLKRFVLPRPELVPVTGDYTQNSFPSGHTTIAVSLLFALILVVPFRLRGVAMFASAFYAVAIGAQTVTSKWHRLSDTLGADMIALMVACTVVAVLARQRALDPVIGAGPRSRVVFVVVPLALLGAAALVAGGLVLGLSEIPAAPDETLDYNMYLASHALAAAGSVLTALVFWASLRRLGVGTPAPARP